MYQRRRNLGAAFLFAVFLILGLQNCSTGSETPISAGSQKSPSPTPFPTPGPAPAPSPFPAPAPAPGPGPAPAPAPSPSPGPQPLSINGSWKSPCAQDVINTEIFNTIYTITFSGNQRTVRREVYVADGGCNDLREVDTFAGTFSVATSPITYNLSGVPTGAWNLDYTTQWTHIRLTNMADVTEWKNFNGGQGACGTTAWALNTDVPITGTPCGTPLVSIYTTAVPTATQLNLAIRTSAKPGDSPANRPVGPEFALYSKVQ